MDSQVEVFWNGELVGFIRQPKCDNFHLYGHWVQAEGRAAIAFEAALRTAFARWDTEMAGINVVVGRDDGIAGEFTDLTDGTADILMRFPDKRSG